MALTIGKDGFSLPLELVTSTQAIRFEQRQQSAEQSLEVLLIDQAV